MSDWDGEIRRFVDGGIQPVTFEDVVHRATRVRKPASIFSRTGALKAGLVSIPVAVAIVASVVLLSPSTARGHSHVNAKSRAASAAQITLDKVATNAEVASSTAPAAGQSVAIADDFQLAGYVSGASGQVAEFTVSGTAQWLIGQHGSGTEQIALGSPAFASASSEAVWVSLGSPKLVPDQTFTEEFPLSAAQAQSVAAQNGLGALPVTPTVVPYSEVSKLSTNPAVLQSQIVDQFEGGVSNVGQTFDLVASLLEEGAGPAQRAALYRVISTLPGVTLDGATTTDVTNTAGTAISVDTSGERHVLVFDPASSVVLEERFLPDGHWPESIPSLGASTAVSDEMLSYTVFRSVMLVNQ